MASMRNFIRLILNHQWWRFQWRYWRRLTPWDTQITPPEVMDFIERTPPGRALDLGCGTGTNAITLTRHGWQTTGVDFSTKAITTARKKADRQRLEIDFHVADVSDLSFLTQPFDYILDIGCLFILDTEQQQRYAAEVARLLRPGGDYMLYAWLPQYRDGRKFGLSAENVSQLFSEEFIQTDMVVGEDGPGKSAWYWLKRPERSISGTSGDSQ